MLKSCEVCKGLFKTATDRNVCPKCMLGNEVHFKRIKEYLQEHPGAAMPIVAEKTGISISLIEQYLRQERVEIAPGSPIKLGCNKCGAQILTGTYCDACGKDMVRELQKIKDTIITQEQEEESQLKYITAKWRSR